MSRPNNQGALRIAPESPAGQWGALFLITLAVAAAAGLGALASIEAREFYATLAKPAWAPPAAVFGPVWTLLYVLMIAAGWLVWRARGGFRGAAVPLALFGVQLLLNALWSWLFFRWHAGLVALIDVCLLWLVLLMMVLEFRAAKPLAALLSLPYLLWVCFATALTAAVWHLNPTLL